jgi:hypothetical protein
LSSIFFPTLLGTYDDSFHNTAILKEQEETWKKVNFWETKAREEVVLRGRVFSDEYVKEKREMDDFLEGSEQATKQKLYRGLDAAFDQLSGPVPYLFVFYFLFCQMSITAVMYHYRQRLTHYTKKWEHYESQRKDIAIRAWLHGVVRREYHHVDV